MKHLSISKKILAVLGAGLLVAAVSSIALARIVPGPTTQRVIDKRGAEQLEPEQQVEFSGTLEVKAIDGWTIGGRTVRVNAATSVNGLVPIGNRVKVHAQVQADGSLVALQIQLENNGQVNQNANENQNSNVNSNENENENENQNDNVNSNSNENENDNDDGNVNSNESENENENENHNGNVNSNENENEDHNDNVNSNETNDDHGDNHDGGGGDD